MPMITCNCGNKYDSGFKFCPECAAPNPEYAKRNTPANSDENTARPVKRKFTKVGESSLNKSASEPQKAPAPAPAKAVAPKKSYTVVRQNTVPVAKPVQPKPVAEPAELYEEYEDEEDEIPETPETSDYEDYDYEDEESEVEESYEESYEDEDYEDEDEEEEEDVPVAPVKTSLPLRSKGKVLAAPIARSNRNVEQMPTNVVPKTKTIKQTKSSLGKKKAEYDPNHDGYYDDRLPAILDEVTKTSHLDVVLKISLSVVCIAALITYCIFYVQV